MSNLQALHHFCNTPINNQMLHCLVNSTLKVLPQPPSSSTNSSLPSLFTFITKLVKHTNVFTGTLMATLVYLKKLGQRLPPNAISQEPSARHKIFLACLILSAKFHNDASPKNKHWSKYTEGLFTTSQVNKMERYLLIFLDWDITVTNQDLLAAWKDFLDPIKLELKNVMRLKTFLHQQSPTTRPSPPSTSASLRHSPTSHRLPIPSPATAHRQISRSQSTNTNFTTTNRLPPSTPLRKFPSLPQLSSVSRKNFNYNSIQHLRSMNPTPSSSSSSSSSYSSSYSSASSSVSTASSTYTETFALSPPPSASSSSSSIAGSPDYRSLTTPKAIPFQNYQGKLYPSSQHQHQHHQQQSTEHSNNRRAPRQFNLQPQFIPVPNQRHKINEDPTIMEYGSQSVY
ncbi:hypothetical protein DASC09_014600 [Saccharomycopsis crataegensis]|uniref:Cyclin N-terminal domain-containing protein n=1 Tax=Saccharomycopsis crataegensis TaxID=43959 RepID=A0AAV5QGS5_9ASCO|nr:hypothetical protein DASC09_014600 [Saccharomycopsis crataegensis]